MSDLLKIRKQMKPSLYFGLIERHFNYIFTMFYFTVKADYIL